MDGYKITELLSKKPPIPILAPIRKKGTSAPKLNSSGVFQESCVTAVHHRVSPHGYHQRWSRWVKSRMERLSSNSPPVRPMFAPTTNPQQITTEGTGTSGSESIGRCRLVTAVSDLSSTCQRDSFFTFRVLCKSAFPTLFSIRTFLSSGFEITSKWVAFETTEAECSALSISWHRLFQEDCGDLFLRAIENKM